MAFYNTGTIAVTNGSATVTGIGIGTGTGTAFVGAVRAGDQFNAPDGKIYAVAAVVSNTQLTLNRAYLGSTQTGQAYEVFFTQGRNVAVATALDTLIANYQGIYDGAGQGIFPKGTAALPALSTPNDRNTGLRWLDGDALALGTGGADRLQVNNTGAVLTGLLSGTAVTQSALDATPGRLMKAGDGGVLGKLPILGGSGNLRSRDLTGGVYGYNSGSVPQHPEGGVAWVHSMLVMRASSTLTSSTDRNAYFTNRITGSGSNLRTWIGVDSTTTDEINWAELITNRRIVGTVSQSAGLPTGAVIEHGSTANGEYVRFADGTQICWRDGVSLGSIIGAGSGTFAAPYRTDLDTTVTWPAAFAGLPSVSARATLDNNSVAPEARMLPVQSWTAPTSTTWPGIRAYRGSSSNVADNALLSYMAIGRWF